MPSTTHRPGPYQGPTREEVLAMRREFLAPSLLTYYRDPVMIVEGSMQWLFDETGRAEAKARITLRLMRELHTLWCALPCTISSTSSTSRTSKG